MQGYRPTERDREAADRLLQSRHRSDRIKGDPAAHLKIIEAIVERALVEPAARARVLEAARQTLARWFEREAVSNGRNGAVTEKRRERSR